MVYTLTAQHTEQTDYNLHMEMVKAKGHVSETGPQYTHTHSIDHK